MVRLKKKAREAKEKKEEDDEEDRREEQSKLDKRAVLYQKKAAADAASDAAAEEAAVEERKREEERKRDEGGKREEEREKKEMVKLANSDPINLKTYQEIKDYMEAVLYVLREQEGVSPEQEKNERTKSEGLFEDNKSEIASLVADISKKFDRFIFVVVGGAAVKAHHATESRTGHKTTDFDIKVYPTEELGYSVDSKEGKTWVARSRFDIFKALKTWKKRNWRKLILNFLFLKVLVVMMISNLGRKLRKEVSGSHHVDYHMFLLKYL